MLNSTILFISNSREQIPYNIRKLFDDSEVVYSNKVPFIGIKTELGNYFETLSQDQVSDGNRLRGRSYRLVILDKRITLTDEAKKNLAFAQCMFECNIMQLL